MPMDQKQEQVVVEWPGHGARPPLGASERSTVAEDRTPPCRQDPGCEAIFDIADFEAIAAFAGLRPPMRRAG